MKHPSHTSRSPGGASGRARSSGRPDEPDDAPEYAPEGEPDGQIDGEPDAAGEHPHDLLARELDGLRSEIETLAATEPADIDERAETVRERYSELLDDYNDDPEALTRIRALGRRIKDLEEAGSLPRSLIRRGRSRR
jgi:hypothetical protein